MADTTDTTKTEAAAGAHAGNKATASPTNLNNSPSPSGDGVQSSASERQAAGDTSLSQGSQQRINAAERRENRESSKSDDKAPAGPVNAVQSPGEVAPALGSGVDLSDAVERHAADAKEVERLVDEGNLPQSTLDEINAGKNALKGGEQRRRAELGPTTAPTNPVDATERSQQTAKQ